MLKDLYQEDINNLSITEYFLQKLVKKYINKYQVQSFVKKVVFDSALIHGIGAYNAMDRIVYVDMFKIYDYVVERPDIDEIVYSNDTTYIYEYIYLLIIQTLIHELIHVKQEKMKYDPNVSKDIKNLFSLSTSALNTDLYLKNHDLFPSEHHADAYSSIECYNLEKELGSSLCLNDFLIDNLINGYIIIDNHSICPTARFYKEYLGVDNMTVNLNSNYMNLLFGLPIELKVHKELISLKNNDNIDILSYVKRL